jgi:hypothetical protein
MDGLIARHRRALMRSVAYGWIHRVIGPMPIRDVQNVLNGAFFIVFAGGE